MSFTELKTEVMTKPEYSAHLVHTLFVDGFNKDSSQSNVLRRADGDVNVFIKHKKYVYKNDRILGSMRGVLGPSEMVSQENEKQYGQIGQRFFWTCHSHYAPNYSTLLSRGIDGTIDVINASKKEFKDDQSKIDFLTAAERTLLAMSAVMEEYSDIAEEMGLTEAAANCRIAAHKVPETFAQALQLVWMPYLLFMYEERYDNAFGRMDQYLYPFFKADMEKGIINHDEARELVAAMLIKIHEATYIMGGDDVANIAIGGVKPEDGSDATNELSYVILEAVNQCHIPGPNLSAKLHKDTKPEFIDACLKVIGTGLGYPALMNDDVNIRALSRYGYSLEDCRNYCMVGCIENFIQGKQPPWSDGRFNSPKYLELALNNGICMLTGDQIGPKTGDASEFDTMDKFMKALHEQLAYGADQYVNFHYNVNKNVDAPNFQQPFLSCFCDGCLERGLDINMGGAIYPSAHGACCMGIATIADCLAAIEKLVYVDKVMTLPEMVSILKANFEGHEDERQLMLSCPKYGNNDDFVDKYAKWFIEEHYDIFKGKKTFDGGSFYIAIASNVQNIDAGKSIAATPDGRLSRAEVSDAASPMHGMDVNGPTAAFLSLCKPDYTKSATGTVVNQKYPPSMFTDDEKRKKLGALIKVYFAKGGQEVQINSVSRDVLRDAMSNPDKYQSMVVRVSGFSAYYTRLGKDVQTDILKRTEHAEI